jgi:hypothetical protein
MLWTPQKGRTRIITNLGETGTNAPGTNVPSSATPDAKGAVTDIISAANNNQDSWGIYIAVFNTGSASTVAQARLEILIGGATDDILIPGLVCGYTTLQPAIREFFFPLHVPQGKRIAATLASVRASINCQCVIMLYGGGVPPFRVGRKVTAYGTPISDSRGQAITPSQSGAAASVTEMIASTGADHFAFLPGFQPATDTTISTRGYAIGIGVGSDPPDRIGTWNFLANNSESMGGPRPMLPALQDVPAGSRLTFLAGNDGSNDGGYDGLIYAVS